MKLDMGWLMPWYKAELRVGERSELGGGEERALSEGEQQRGGRGEARGYLEIPGLHQHCLPRHT